MEVVESPILKQQLGLTWRTGILVGLLVAGWGCSDSFAQGSMGGIIGKEEKSVSGTGSSEPERPARKSKAASEARRAPVREASGSGSVSRFDGKWTFVATGCSAGKRRGAISGGTISGWGGAGQVSASGAMRASFTVWGIDTVAVGHLSGATGAGTYSRADGCKGPWTVRKQ